MKIIVNADGVIWNEYLPVLMQLRPDVIVVKYISPEAFRPAHEGFTYLLADPHQAQSAGKSAKREALQLAGGRLMDYIGDDNDVVLLTDNDPVSFYPYDYLKEQFRTRRIHLLSCLPFSYENRRRKEEIRAYLSDLRMAHSLCLVELDSLLRTSDTEETMGRLQVRIRKFLQELLVYATEQLSEMDVFQQYLFDPESGRYVETDLTGWMAAYEKGSRAPSGRQTAAAEPSETDLEPDFEPMVEELLPEKEELLPEAEELQESNSQAEALQTAAEDAVGDAAANTSGEAPESDRENTEGDAPENAGRQAQPKEVDITYKCPARKPSFFARLFGKGRNPKNDNS